MQESDAWQDAVARISLIEALFPLKQMGSSQKQKLSTPFGLSATAKNDLRSHPSTRTITKMRPSSSMAPALNAAFTPIRSSRYGLVAGFRSNRQARGAWAAVTTG